MAERWVVQGTTKVLTGNGAVESLRAAHAAGTLTTWFESDGGRILALITNGQRAMVLLMDHEGDAGEHAVTPDATGEASGFVLENGQEDTYSDRDTVPLDDGYLAVAHIVDTGSPPPGLPWAVDR
jgi:hypothetical protein